MSNFYNNRRFSVQQFHAANNIKSAIIAVNMQVALYRELLIYVGHPRDCPELRERIRRIRRQCVDECRRICHLIMPQLHSAAMEGIPADNPNLVLHFYVTQQLLKEITRSRHIIQAMPMDMSGYYDNRAGPSNIGNVISQILLCKAITPDFNEEEVYSITKDAQDIALILTLMDEYMPSHDNKNLEKRVALQGDINKSWSVKRRRNSVYENMGFFCCIRRNNYL